jgi:acetyltransferase
VIDPAHRYPTHLIDVVRLENASRVVVRPPLPQDRELHRLFVRTLSDEARYFRFMTKLSELSEAMAERFTSIDYRSHVALIATVFADAGETMIGDARYVIDEGGGAVCEFAVAVADACKAWGWRAVCSSAWQTMPQLRASAAWSVIPCRATGR